MDDASCWTTSPERHFQSVEDEVGVECFGHCPADWCSGENVDDARQVEEAFASPHIFDVGDVDLVWSTRGEVALSRSGDGATPIARQVVRARRRRRLPWIPIWSMSRGTRLPEQRTS